MSIIAVLDSLALLATFSGLVYGLLKRRQTVPADIKMVIAGLLIVTSVYYGFLLVEWLGITHTLDSFEDMTGAMLPILWIFLFYSFIQHGISQDLRNNKENLRVTLHSIGDAVIATDISGRITRMNPVAEYLSGWKFDEAKGKRLEEVLNLIHANTRKRIINPVEHVLETGKKVSLGNHTVLISRNGMEYHITDSAAPIFSDDEEMLGVVLIFSDISASFAQAERLRAQIKENQALVEEYLSQNEELTSSIARIQAINEELTEAKINAEESYRLKSAFLANMSHEIRTPMNGIIGFSELLADSELDTEKRKYYAKIIIESSRQLLTLVNDILDLSRIETGKVPLFYEEVVVNDLINVLYAFFEPQTGSKNITLHEVKSLSNAQSTIKTDKTRLRQVFTNLLNNALKFTSDGYIKFGYTKTNEFLQFFVEDTGIGIPEDLHEKIFEPFRQVQLEVTQQYGGTGLGLSISTRLIELLGGKIWLESKPGQGSIFYFTIPYKAAAGQVREKDKKEKQTALQAPGMVVLIAEDDNVNYLYLETVLSKSRVKLIRANNGIEAYEQCMKYPEIQLVLMDIKMPFMNGFDATRKIKQRFPDLPVIAQTAYAMNEDRIKAAEAGCDDYIAKPIKKAELLALIDKYSSRGRTIAK